MKYFITFIDDYSRYVFVYLLKLKDKTFEKFMDFKTRAERQTRRNLKRLRSDRGGEYRSKEFTTFHMEHGIENETIAPCCPQSNGVAKRENTTLTKMVNSMLLTIGLSNCYQGKAVLSASYILNKVPFSKMETTPHELWFKIRPSLGSIRV